MKEEKENGSVNKFREDFIKLIKVYPRVLFFELRNNDFANAKKFFGEGVYKVRVHKFENGVLKENVYDWQYHLSKMVLCDDPLEYIENYKNAEWSKEESNG